MAKGPGSRVVSSEQEVVETDAEGNITHQSRSGFEVNTPFGSFKARGYDALQVLTVILIFAVGGALAWLVNEANQVGKAVVTELTHLRISQAQTTQAMMISANTQRESLMAQRMTQCILIAPENRRKTEMTDPTSTCSLLARYPPPNLQLDPEQRLPVPGIPQVQTPGRSE